MRKNKIIAAFMSAALAFAGSAAAVQPVSAADDKCKVTFLDYDGKVITVLTVDKGSHIDYASVNTDSLHKHIDKFTEQDFASWDIRPEIAETYLTIHTLFKTAFISLDGVPAVTSYFSRSGKVDLFGFKAAITVTTQIPEKDANGNYKTQTQTIDITDTCTASPSNLKEAFYTSDTATVDILPLGDDKPLYSYVIYCYDYLGDVDENGIVYSMDSTTVLTSYAKSATNASYSITSEFMKRGDVNMDGVLDARDASYILYYYAKSSVGADVDWNTILGM